VGGLKMNRIAWVILWKFSDNSGCGILELAYEEEEDCDATLKLLTEHGDIGKEFKKSKIIVVS
jgi:hypothetical protein